jgi:hypothetical protein
MHSHSANESHICNLSHLYVAHMQHTNIIDRIVQYTHELSKLHQQSL